ncbi:hypothetical protein BESB_013730 [Besnoitia besnoiti]|uniref:Uncharacterized protein n=1 Tax=Besnoitia besnoiti TaxID=94643 RepID=A0A2A9M8W4_BESBE|nr:hypothetical protein BESB_013730 [Besnoitia besnoiti]PFH32761.1 hypothetical protein BESB_013730 [Besnoitia besnoiti]
MEPWKQKVPPYLSLHGSNSLRGGKKTYNCNVLVDNWRNDRLDDRNDQRLTSERILHPLHPDVPQGSKYETNYRQSYDYEDWSRRPVHLSKYGILGHDDTGAESWTTESRSEYQSPRRRAAKLMAQGHWCYGKDIYPRMIHGRDDFLFAHPMAIHLSPTHRQEYVHALASRPPHERPPPELLRASAMPDQMPSSSSCADASNPQCAYAPERRGDPQRGASQYSEDYRSARSRPNAAKGEFRGEPRAASRYPGYQATGPDYSDFVGYAGLPPRAKLREF